MNFKKSTRKILPNQNFTLSLFYFFVSSGNMWAQTWGNIVDLCLPHPDVQSIDITDALVNQVK